MRRIIIVLLLFISVFVPLFSLDIPQTDRLSFYVRGTLSPSFASEKIYSYPAKNGSIHGLLGFDAATDIYMNDETAKAGMSADVFISYPVISKKFVSFISEDTAEKTVVLHASFGAIFRCTPQPYIDASIALRFGILSYDAFSEAIILTATVEPRIDFFLSSEMFFTCAFSVTNGFLKLTPGHQEIWYESGYTTLIARLEIGMGWKIGGDRKR